MRPLSYCAVGGLAHQKVFQIFFFIVTNGWKVTSRHQVLIFLKAWGSIKVLTWMKEPISKHGTQIMNSNCNLKVMKSRIIQLFSQKVNFIYNLLLFYKICDFFLTFFLSSSSLSLHLFSVNSSLFCIVLTFI
jgi:hypothetical protein